MNVVVSMLSGRRTISTRNMGIIERDSRVDVVVVGGGAVGLAAACMLRAALPRATSIALVEPTEVVARESEGDDDESRRGNPRLQLRLPPDARQSTINGASRRALERCGAWKAIEDVGAAVPVRDMQVHVNAARTASSSEAKQSGAVLRWHASDVGEVSMAHCVENAVLVQALRAAAEEVGVVLVGGLTLEALALPRPDELGGGRDAVLTLARARCTEEKQAEPLTLRARLVVGADGGRSACARLAGIRRRFERDYAQRAVVGVVRTDADDAMSTGALSSARLKTASTASTAYQVFGADSEVLAMLPTRGGWRSIVWSVRAERAAALQALPPREFAAAANEAFGRVPGAPVPEITDAVVGASFPLAAHHAGSYARARLALVGDAAHGVHPMAGQGANLGIADAAALADAVAAAVRSGEDIGDPGVLARYERRRRGANAAMMGAIDALFAAFGVGAATASARARDFGMRALNWLAPVKNEAMMVAMGERGVHEFFAPSSR